MWRWTIKIANYNLVSIVQSLKNLKRWLCYFGVFNYSKIEMGDLLLFDRISKSIGLILKQTIKNQSC